MPASPVATKIPSRRAAPKDGRAARPARSEASVGVMPKASGSVFECGAPHQASQHRLNVTTCASHGSPRFGGIFGRFGRAGKSGRLSSTIVIRVCIHSKERPYLAAEGLWPPDARIGACASDQPGGRSMSATYTVVRRLGGGSLRIQPRSPAPPRITTLYQRLGGYDSIQAVVDEAIKNIAADKRINKLLHGRQHSAAAPPAGRPDLRGSGGPCIYTGAAT